MAPSARRIVAISALAAGLLIVAALLILHLPFARTRVFDFAARQLASRYNLDLQADSLGYNLFTRRVTLANVRLAALGHEADPFVTARRIDVGLPWSIFRGLLSFDHIELDGAVVSMRRYEDGASNLPASGGTRDPGLPPLRLEVRGFVLDGLDFEYTDQLRNMAIAAGDLHTTLAPGTVGDLPGVSGPIEIRKGVRLTFGDRAVTADPISGSLAFDGSSVMLRDVGLKTVEGTLNVNGRVERVLDRPGLDLQFTGTADVAQAAAWGTLPVTLAGQAALSGTISGAAAAPTIALQTTSDALDVGRVTGVSQQSQVTVTTGSVVIDKSTVTAGGGSVEIAATIPFAADEPVKAAVSWRGLDARTLFALADQPDRPIAASMTGTLQYERTGAGPLMARISNTATPRSSASALSIGGELGAGIANGRWEVKQQHTVPGALSVKGNLGGAIDGTNVATATIGGQLEVGLDDVARAAQAIETLGLDLPAVAGEIGGPATAMVTLAGRVNALEVKSRVDSPALRLPALAPAAVHADVDVTPAMVQVANVTAEIGGATLGGQATIDLQSRALSGAFELNAPDVGAVLAERPGGVTLKGPVTATATLGGTAAEPDIAIEAHGEGLDAGGQPIDTLVASARVTGDRIAVESFRAQQRDGELSGSGSYAWGSGAYTADVIGTNLSWTGPLVGATESTVRVTTVTYSGGGTIDDPGGTARAEFEITGGVAGTLIGQGNASASFAGGTAAIIAHVPALGAFVDSRIATRAPYRYDAVAVVNRIDLATLAPMSGAPENTISGTVSLSATASGTVTDAAASRVFVNLQQIEATVAEVPVVMSTPARLTWEASTLSVDQLDLQVGSGRMTASATHRAGSAASASSVASVAFDGELGDLVKMGRAFGGPAELTGSGPIVARWQSTDGIEQSTGTVQLTGGTLAWGELPAITGLTLQAAFDGQMLDVSSLSGTWQEGGIQGSARIPRAVLDGSAASASTPATPGHAELRVTKLNAAAFEPWLGSEALSNIHGQVSASLTAEIPSTNLMDMRATFLLDEAAFTVAALELAQQRPSRVTLAHGVATVEDVAWLASGSPVFLTGTVTLAPAEQRTLNLALVGNLDLKMLSAFTPTLATEGAGAVNVWADGPLNDPRFTGQVVLKDAGLAIRDPRIIVGQMNGPIVLDGRTVSFDGITGVVNGGDLSLHGRLNLESQAIAGGQLVMQIRQAALEFPDNLQSELSGIVTVTPQRNDWVVGGDVRVERSSYTEPISIAALAASRRGRAPVAARNGGPAFGDRIRLNLSVTTDEDIRIDNNYGRLEAGASVRLVGTVSRPGATGRVTLREGGQFFLAGNTFFIERGSISFTSASRIQPEIDLQARGVAGGTDMRLTITGPPDKLQTNVTPTDPQLGISDQEARSRLMGGLVGDEAALTLLSGELLGVTGRALGLDALRLDTNFDAYELRADPTLIATETDPTTRLTLSKRLRPDTELILSQSLSDSGALSAIISYKPRRNIEIRASSRDNIDRSIAVRHEITFGGSGTVPTRAPARPTVSAITILGTPGRSEQEIRAELRIDVGDRFDFHRWQRDVDDIRERYIREGFFEVRVRATRDESPDGTTVALTYTIQRGPRTRLVIEGHPVEPHLVRELEEAWTRIIFDQFLIDEFRERIRRHLFSENWIGSTVDAKVTVSTPEDKEVTVTVTPGVQVKRHVIRYAGETTVEHKRLDGAIAAAGLTIDGWLDPPAIATTLETFYRDQGFLSVKAAAGEPTVEGDSGVLVVLLEEGPRYTIARVDVPGSARERLFVTNAVEAIAPGTPFDRALIERTTADIERRYLRRGYNDVEIETQSNVTSGAATVDLVFQIDEGLRQVLRELSTDGVVRTRDGVVRRALRLGVGQPVDLDRWAQARKRMYDTNVFRQVDIEPVRMDQTPEDKAANVQPMRAVVRVIEYPAWRLRYGAQYREERTDEEATARTTQKGFGVLADLQNQNLFGQAITSGVAVSLQPQRQATSLFAQNASFFSLPVRSNIFVFGVNEDDQVGDFETTTERRGVSLEQRWRPFRRAEVVYGYRYEWTHLFQTSPVTEGELGIDNIVRTGRLRSAVFIDRRSDPFNAVSGWFSSINFDKAAPFLGADASYTKTLLQQFYYQKVGPIVLAWAARVGLAYHPENIDFDNRFFAGGGTTVRGYAQDSLGPRLAGQPEGGGSLLVFNQEVRFPISRWFGGVAFVDAGNVWETRSSLSVTDLRFGYGLGLRLNTPFALLRVDYGVPGSSLGGLRRANSFADGRWYFGIGQIF